MSGEPEPCDEQCMELLVETLTGTSFEMKVYPSDTILDIKKKIQRVEGIPVHHQNLLHGYKEVHDGDRLCDVGIENGSKLRLVLSMRGGPISMRRLSALDHYCILKDLTELFEHTRDEMSDKPSTVNVLLYTNDNKVVNVIRVIVNDDGTYQAYDVESGGPNPTSSASDRLERNPAQEHRAMVGKVKELRGQMLKRRQQRRNAPVGHVGLKPTVAAGSATASQHDEHENRCRMLQQFKENAASLIRLNRTQFGDDTDTDESDTEGCCDDDEEIVVQEGAAAEESIALKEKHWSKNNYNALFHEPFAHRIKILKEHALPAAQQLHRDSTSDERNSYCVSQRKRVTAKRMVHKYKDVSDFNLSTASTSSDSSVTETGTKEMVSPIDILVPAPRRLAPLLLQDRPKEELETDCDIFSRGGHESAAETFRSSKLSVAKRWQQSVDCSTEEMPSSSSLKNECEVDFEVLDSDFHLPSLFPSATAPSTSEQITDLYLNRRQDRVSRSPLYRRYSQTSVANEPTKSEAGDGRRDFSSSWGPPTDHSSDGLLNIQPFTGAVFNFLGGQHGDDTEHTLHRVDLNPLRIPTDRRNDSDIIDKIKELSISEDPKVLPTVVARKKMRCARCNKRLNVTNMYSCRCGGTFCAQHRYSEVHGCGYDYKTEGRRLLSRQNPLVVASKLNKL